MSLRKVTSLHSQALMTYLVVSALATWPLLTRLQGWVPGFGDWGQNMWALWWVRRALLVLQQSPYFTQYLFYPAGVTLLFHPLDVIDGLLTLPVYGLLGGDVSYNLVVLLSFVLSGLGAYYLALYLTHNRWGSLLAGLVFAFSPYHFLRLELGHLNLSTMQWIPFYVLFFLKFIRRGSLRFAAIAVFFMVLNALCSWYYVAACGLLSLAGLAWPRPAAIPWSRLAIRVIGVLAVSSVVLSPLLVPMLGWLNSSRFVGEHNPLRHSVDGLSYWFPGPPSSWAGWFAELWAPYAAQQREPGASAYLGYVVLIISIVGLIGWRKRREVWWWLMLGAGFAVLSAGPQLQWAGRLLDVRLPYWYLDQYLPGFDITGIPGRFVVVLSLAMAVLAAYGLSFLVARCNTARAAWIASVISLLVVVEFLAVPLDGSRTDVPAFYERMAGDREPYTVLDVKWDANYLMHAQTVHGKALIGGWLARLPVDQARYLEQGSLDRVISYLLLGEEATHIADAAALRRALNEGLARHQTRYIIDHDHAVATWIEHVLGWRAVCTEQAGDHIAVYAAAP